jgi:hypothetical protein
MAKLNFKPKIDLSQAKKFMFEKGERVVLGLCGFIALVLLVFGFMGAMGFGKPSDGYKTWPEALDKCTQALKAKVDAATPASTDDTGEKIHLAALSGACLLRDAGRDRHEMASSGGGDAAAGARRRGRAPGRLLRL